MNDNKKLLVINYLMGELHKLEPGDKLSSNLKLQKICKVSQSVVTRAIDELKTMGLIEIRPKSGFYKKEVAKMNVHIVYLRKGDTSISETNSFYNTHLSAIFNALTMNGYGVNFYNLNDINDLAKKLNKGSSHYIGNDIIITFSLPISQLGSVRQLEQQNFRFIHWLPDFNDKLNNSITIDEHQLVQSQIKFLVGLGHKRIAYAHRCVDGVWSRSANGRYDEFCRQNINFQLQILPEFLFYMDSRYVTQEEANSAIKRAFSGTMKPTALIIVDVDAKMIYNALESNNILPGQDIAVLGTNNQHWCKYMTPQLSGVGFDLQSGIEHLMMIINSENKDWKFPAWTFPIIIENRESTTFIPNATNA